MLRARALEQAAQYRAIALDAIAAWQGQDDRADDKHRRGTSARTRAELRSRMLTVDAALLAVDPPPSGASPQATGGYIHHSLTDWIPTPGCDCDRCTSARKSAPKPTGGASPQAETRRDCTCLGTCRGAEGLGPRWKCALETPAPVSPVEPTPANYDDPKTWASGVLNTGQSRVEPTGASPQSDMTQCDYCCTWRSRPCGEGCCWQPASLAPVEPTPEPETCEWREWNADGYGKPACRPTNSGTNWHRSLAAQMKKCPECGKPLRLVPSEEPK